MDMLKSLPEIIGLIAGSLGMVVSFIVSYYFRRRMLEGPNLDKPEPKIEKKPERTLTEKEEKKMLTERVAVRITESVISRSDFGVDSLGVRVDKLESGLKELKELLFGNPEVSVTIPLIKRDIESLKEYNERLREEMGRMNDFTKWFIGIMITMSIGLFGLAISILLKG